MKTDKEKNSRRAADQFYWRLILWPIVMLFIAVLCLGAHRISLAAIFVALSIYYIACKTAPALLNHTTMVLMRRSKYRQAEQLTKFGLSWCKFLNIGAAGNSSEAEAASQRANNILAGIS